MIEQARPEDGSGRWQGMSGENEITDGYRVSPPGNLMNGNDLKNDRRYDEEK